MIEVLPRPVGRSMWVGHSWRRVWRSIEKRRDCQGRGGLPVSSSNVSANCKLMQISLGRQYHQTFVRTDSDNSSGFFYRKDAAAINLVSVCREDCNLRRPRLAQTRMVIGETPKRAAHFSTLPRNHAQSAHRYRAGIRAARNRSFEFFPNFPLDDSTCWIVEVRRIGEKLNNGSPIRFFSSLSSVFGPLRVAGTVLRDS